MAAAYGWDSNDAMAVTHDVLLPALIVTQQNAAACLWKHLSMCHDKYGPFSLAAIQCLRNIAHSARRQGDVPAAEKHLR